MLRKLWKKPQLFFLKWYFFAFFSWFFPQRSIDKSWGFLRCNQYIQTLHLSYQPTPYDGFHFVCYNGILQFFRPLVPGVKCNFFFFKMFSVFLWHKAYKTTQSRTSVGIVSPSKRGQNVQLVVTGRFLKTFFFYVNHSDQRIVIFPANRNRNRFLEPTFVQIGIGIVSEFQNLRIGKGKIFVRWEVFANNSQIPDIFFSLSKNFFKQKNSWLLYIFHLKNLPGKQSHSEIYSYSLYIFNIRIKYSWIL